MGSGSDDSKADRQAFERELEELIAEIDGLEEKWRALPDAIKETMPELAQWFNSAPTTKH